MEKNKAVENLWINWEKWAMEHKEELIRHTGNYILVGEKSGIMCVGRDKKEIREKIIEMVGTGKYEEGEETYIISAIFIDKSKWAEA